MKSYKIGALSLLILTGSAGAASADYIADLTYDYVDNGGGNYTFNVTVANNSSGSDSAGLDFFMINFDVDADVTRYTNITWGNDNSWFSQEADFNLGFSPPLPGYVSADDSILVLGGGGISQGNSLSFSFSFNYAGSLAAAAQTFSWIADFGTHDDPSGLNYDASFDYGYAAEDAGNLVYSPNTNNPVPEPTTLLLFGTGLAGLIAARRKKILK